MLVHGLYNRVVILAACQQRHLLETVTTINIDTHLIQRLSQSWFIDVDLRSTIGEVLAAAQNIFLESLVYI